MEISDFAFIKEEIGKGDAFFLVAGGAVAEIENDVFGALFLEIGEFGFGLFDAVAGEAFDVQIADLIGHQLGDDARIRNVGAGESDFFGFGIAQAEDGDGDGGTGIAAQEFFGIGERHVARGNVINAFDEIAGGDIGLVGGGAGQGIDDGDVTVTLSEDETDAGFAEIGAFFVLAVLIGVEIAGEGVDGFEETVDCAEGDALHVRFFDVFQLDALEHFGVDLEMPVNIIVRDSAAAASAEEEKHHNTGGAANNCPS